MHNATQPTYVLTDEKLKKVAKGVKKRLNESLPKEHALSHQSILQVLSQELFSMPYEEAKGTILSQGINILGGNQSDGVSVSEAANGKGGISVFNLEGDVDYNDFRTSLLTLGWIVPLSEVGELKPYLHVINDMPDGALPNINFIPNTSYDINEMSETWHDEDLVFGACMVALHYYASQGADELTLSRMREVLTLNQAIKWMNSATLPSNIKALLGRALHVNEIASNGEVRLNGLVKFDESVELYRECIGAIVKYIDKEKQLKNEVKQTSVGEFNPSPELVLLDSITTLQSIIPLHVMMDLESIKSHIDRVMNGTDDVVLTIRHQNAIRKKEMGSMWHERAGKLIETYTDAYLCCVGVTMQAPRFFDLVAGFNLDNLAAMSMDKELPFELRKDLKEALNAFRYKWGTDKQSSSTLEHFDYVVMELSGPAERIKSYILDSIK
jgi:hypothetical protein